MKSTARQIAVNTLTGWGSVLARSVLAFVLVPFLLQQLGRSSYGIVGLLGVLLSFAEVADLGLRQALGRELAEQAARGDRQRFNELASTGLLLYMVIGILLATACILFTPPLIAFFNVPLPMRPMALRAVRIYGAGGFLLSFAGAVYTAALTSANRFDLRNNIEAGCRIATGAVLILGLGMLQNRLLAWVWITLAGQLLTVLLLALAARRTIPWMRLAPAFARLQTALSLLQFGWKVYVLQLTNLVAERSDPLVVSRFFGPAGVALYTPGGQLAGIVRPILLTLAAQLTPLATRQYVENALEKQQRMLTQGTRFTVLLGSLFSVGLFVFAEPFCVLWVGKALGANYHTVATVIQLWAVADFLACVTWTLWPMMLGARNLNAMMAIYGAAAVANIGLSVYFVGFTPMGVTGTLLGTVLINSLLLPILVTYGTRIFQLPLSTFLRTALIRPVLLALLLLPIAYAIRFSIPPHGYLPLLLGAILTGITWVMLVLVLAFSRQERKLLCTYARNMREP